MGKGTLKTNGVHLKPHELATVKLLLENGYDVELIPPLKIEGMQTPDISTGGLSWEMKCPNGGGKTTIRHTVKKALHQSGNLIIDLRLCKVPEQQAIKELEQHFRLSKRMRRMKIITASENILDYNK